MICHTLLVMPADCIWLLACLLACTSNVWWGDYWDTCSRDVVLCTYADTHIQTLLRARARTRTRTHTHTHTHTRTHARTHARTHNQRKRDCNINLTDSRGSRHCRKCYHLRHTRVCRWRGIKSMEKNRQASAEHSDRRMLSSHRWGENKKMRSVSRRRGCNTLCTISPLEKLNHLTFS